MTTCSDFPSDTMLWIKGVEMVDLLDELKSSRKICGKDFLTFEMLDAQIASALNKIIHNSPLQEEGQSRGAESPWRGSVSSRKKDRLHDLLRFSICSRSWYSEGLRWFVLCQLSWRYCSGIRHEMGWNSFIYDQDPSGDVLESLYKLRIRETGKFISRNRCPIVKNYGSETLISKFWRQTRENRNRCSGHESKGINWRWRKQKKEQSQFSKREKSAVSGMRVTIVHQNRHRKPFHPLSHQWHEVEVSRGKEVSETKVILVSFFDNRADTIFKSVRTRWLSEY